MIRYNGVQLSERIVSQLLSTVEAIAVFQKKNEKSILTLITSPSRGSELWIFSDCRISRQRPWGVPVPVFYDRATGNEVLQD